MSAARAVNRGFCTPAHPDGYPIARNAGWTHAYEGDAAGVDEHGRERINYGCPMGSSVRRTWYPERQLRRTSRESDPLKRKPFFACGEAAKRGWMVMIWQNAIARRLYRDKFRAALAAREVLPLP